ncbi:MAG: glycoside hydrolase family 16 protein [Gemmatimonadetes bacterium]|nr:glycoside hydrolase family 16 protein [Gemmatimonadota bacterium]
MRTVRPFPPAPVLLLALAAACTEASAPTGVDEEPLSSLPAKSATAGVVTDDFDLLDPARWLPGDHALGRGRLAPANVSAAGGAAVLTLPAGRYDGAEIRSAARHGYGSYLARLRTPLAPGSISAFFLYQGVEGGNDEVDVEIHNDGSRRVIFTTWVAGKQTNSVTRTLPFDPAATFHDYRIEYQAGKVRFLVDGALMQQWTSKLPKNAMYVMTNAWWPIWLSGAPATADVSLRVDRIEY